MISHLCFLCLRVGDRLGLKPSKLQKDFVLRWSGFECRSRVWTQIHVVPSVFLADAQRPLHPKALWVVHMGLPSENAQDDSARFALLLTLALRVNVLAGHLARCPAPFISETSIWHVDPIIQCPNPCTAPLYTIVIFQSFNYPAIIWVPLESGCIPTISHLPLTSSYRVSIEFFEFPKPRVSGKRVPISWSPSTQKQALWMPSSRKHRCWRIHCLERWNWNSSTRSSMAAIDTASSWSFLSPALSTKLQLLLWDLSSLCTKSWPICSSLGLAVLSTCTF